MRFSERIGKREAVKSLQFESMDIDLRNSLWNIVKIYALNQFSQYSSYGGKTDFDKFCSVLWHSFFKLPVDTIKGSSYAEAYIRSWFYSKEWYDVYDFVDFLAQLNTSSFPFEQVHYIEAVNITLEKEFSAYRFIDGVLAPISNQVEVEEIQQALDQVHYFTSLKGANIHLTNALEKISDKKNPDYRNSIKESISAVETTCRLLTGESTLGKALNSLESKGITIDNQLKAGFDKIYAYTNNKESGIRHAIMEDHKNPDFNDAKYMLVACSSFINYLVGKCQSLGVALS